MGAVHGYAGNLCQSDKMKLFQGAQANHETFFLCVIWTVFLSQIPKYTCWCKPSSSPGRTALALQASRKRSTLRTAKMHWHRGLKPRSFLAVWGKSATTLGLNWRPQETPSHLPNPVGFWPAVCSLIQSPVQLSCCTDQVLYLSHQLHVLGKEDQYGLFLVAAKSWSHLCSSWSNAPNALVCRNLFPETYWSTKEKWQVTVALWVFREACR